MVKETNSNSREYLGKFFYDLAKTSFAAMVTGALLALFTKNVNVSDCVLLLVIGICSTLVFAGIAYYILKI